MEATQKKLYFNTYDLENSTNGEHKQYEQYCRDFAKFNDMEFIEYNSLNNYDADNLGDGEYSDQQNNDSTGLGLWDAYCSEEPFWKI